MSNFINYFTYDEYRKLKVMDDMYEKAKIIVDRVFKDVKDKGGYPYTNHLYSVSEAVDTIEKKIVGLLHDIVEDTDITLDDLLDIRFSDEIVEAVDLVTKRKSEGESYPEFIDRIIDSNNIIALDVKRADIENNMDLSRIDNPTEKDYERNEKKYKPQYKKLIKVREGRK